MGNLHDGSLQTMYLPNGGDPEQQNAPTLQMNGMLGGKLVNNTPQGNKEYQMVRVDSTLLATPVAPYDGAVAWWIDRSNYKVGTEASAAGGGRGQIAGVFVNDVTPGNYTMIQLRGRHDQVKIVEPPTAAATTEGQFVIPSATDGKADVLAAGTAATYPVLGRTAGVIAGSSVCPVDLDVPEIP